MNKYLGKITFIVLGLILIFHTLIIFKLIYFPYPEIFIYPYLTNNGLKPYQQILDQHFPGLLFLPINFNNLGLTSPDIARIWSVGIVIINQIMLFLIGKKILGSPVRAVLVNLLYLVWQPFLEGWVLWIDSFLPLFLLPAYYFAENYLEESKSKLKLILCGLFLGVAVVFKQTVLPLSALLFIFLVWKIKNLKVVSLYLAGLSIPPLLMIGYFAFIGVLNDFWYWTVVFNLTTYAQLGIKTPPMLGFITRVLLIFGSAFLIILFKNGKYTQILPVFLIGSLFGILDRADFVHFQPALPFAVISTAIVFFSCIKYIKFRLLGLGYVFIALWWLSIFYSGHLSNQVFFYDNQTKEVVKKVQKIVSPKEKIFVFGAVPSLYQMTNTLPAGNILVFHFPWFLKVSESRILEGIKKDQPNIIISDSSSLIKDQKISEYAQAIDRYISENYQQEDRVGTTQILRRKTF